MLERLTTGLKTCPDIDPGAFLLGVKAQPDWKLPCVDWTHIESESVSPENRLK